MSDSSSQSNPPPERRSFMLEAWTVLVGLVVSSFGLVSGLVVFLDPLLRRKSAPLMYRSDEEAAGGKQGFVKVATLDMIPEDGQPRRFPVIDDQIDAWNFTPEQPVGAVYIRRIETDGKSEVLVLHATCPHAGCAVSFKASEEASQNAYHCPCHNSAFDLSGDRVDLPGKQNPSPRPMDDLNYDQERFAADGEIWVEFKNFYTGRHEKKPMV